MGRWHERLRDWRELLMGLFSRSKDEEPMAETQPATTDAAATQQPPMDAYAAVATIQRLLSDVVGYCSQPVPRIDPNIIMAHLEHAAYLARRLPFDPEQGKPNGKAKAN